MTHAWRLAQHRSFGSRIMSIKFFCRCGKHLRAREALAGKRTVCPACGELVGVPFLQPTQRGTAPAPLTPEERANLGRRTVETLPAPGSLAAAAQDVFEFGGAAGHDPSAASKVKRPPRRVLALEKHWYECLPFPIRAWPMVVPLSLVWTALTGIAVYVWPDLTNGQETPTWIRLLVGLAPLWTCAYTCAFLQCVLASAAAGETGFVRWPGSDLRLIVRALLAWLICFLSGPIIFASAAFGFWLHAGIPTWLDWLMIIELTLVGAGHWLLTLVAVHQGDRLRDANPVRVGDVIRRLGYRAVAGSLAASAVGLAFGLLVLHALTLLHDDLIPGFLLLFVAWLGGLAWLTFLFRLLGIWCIQSRVDGWDIASPGSQNVQHKLLAEGKS